MHKDIARIFCRNFTRLDDDVSAIWLWNNVYRKEDFILYLKKNFEEYNNQVVELYIFIITFESREIV